ncbi:MAG: S41 family peptidase [Chloroflexota bacterium]|nr:S41 family peptidase [Chloroflexota bacterium]
MSKIIKRVVLPLLVVATLALAFGTGYNLGTRGTLIPTGQGSNIPGLGTIEQAWGIIFRDYVDRDNINTDNLTQSAIKGLVEALNDPYTSYVDAETYQLGLTDLEGQFGGIGAQVAMDNGRLTVIAPIPDSPAARAGVKPGDVILGIDGKSTEGMSVAEAVLKIRGPKGTTVRVLIQHQGETAPVEIDIVRADIQLPSVRLEMKGDIAHINLTHFSGRTDQEMTAALESAIQQKATGIVLDMRSDPGGLLEAVVDVASHFLKEGVVVNVVDNEGRRTSQSVKNTPVMTDLPMVVLVDKFSASGSEVLAGALQDYKRATIAGTRTFGKGSVNILRRLSDGSGIYITTARWLTPNGRLIEGKGLEPDIELTLTGDDELQWALDYLKKK